MGNINPSPENRKAKRFPTDRAISDAPSKDESNVSNHSSNDQNASDMHLSSRTPDIINSATATDGSVKKIRARSPLQKITRTVSHFTRGRRIQSENSARNQGDASTSDFTPESELKSKELDELDESNSNHDPSHSKNSCSSGRRLVHPYVRPTSLSARPFSTSDSMSLSPNPILASESDRPVFTPVPEEDSKFSPSITGISSRFTSRYVIGTLGRLRSLPSDIYPQRHDREVSASKSQYRQNRLSKVSPSLDSAVLIATPMTCTLMHPPLANKAFPFLPEGTAYLLADEQHRSVEQSLCSMKLSLHRLKRLLIENTGYLHSFTEQSVDNQSPVAASIHDRYTSLSIPRGRSEVDSPSFNSLTTQFSSDSYKEPTNLKDAQQEIQRLREENIRLLDEIVKRDKFIHLFLQNKPDKHQLTL
ncbi:hypothetical protein Aperf_G00000000056 [Anoplocephala perfoliata]